MINSVSFQNILTKICGFFSRSRNRFVKSVFIRVYTRLYDVDLQDANRKSFNQYSSFEDFFTRELDPKSRPICRSEDSIVSPVDGKVAQVGVLKKGSLVQAKGLDFSLEDLLQGSPRSLEGGWYATIYLSPRDYHRIHSPLPAVLKQTTFIPGTKFPVNDKASHAIPDLFTRNLRLVCEFESVGVRHYAIYVGALIVAGIKTRWDGTDTQAKKVGHHHFENLFFDRGEELARFVLGSTVILVFPSELGCLEKIQVGDQVKFGQQIGTITSLNERTEPDQ